MPIRKTLVALVVLAGFLCSPVAAKTFAEGVGDATAPLVAIGIAATYLASDENKTANAARVADAAIISVGLAEVIKPNLNVDKARFRHGFPSGHASIAFGTAAAMGEVFPKNKWLYYTGAALIGWSRVESGAHSWGDVIGGAALGIGVGKWSVSSPNGLMLGRVFRF
ncbi:MAG: phosphatase PAP2 family protein [Armatimonadetes bacterium]|jgi:membrane-associated phospholipid phosphatase|nr:phosphatase PAP2 family protein [Armatimonadota bacterium]